MRKGEEDKDMEILAKFMLLSGEEKRKIIEELEAHLCDREASPSPQAS